MAAEQCRSKSQAAESTSDGALDVSEDHPSDFRQKVGSRARATEPPSNSSVERSYPRWTVIKQFVRGEFSYRIARRPLEIERAGPQLTQREDQVLALACEGHGNKSIAYTLGLSPSTVGVLLFRAAAKLGTKSREELLMAYVNVKKRAPGE